MKRLVNMFVACGLVVGLGTPAFAQDVPASTVPTSLRVQAMQIGAGQAMPVEMSGGSPSGKALVWTGGAIFMAGMGTAIYGFLNNSNGEFPEFGEAEATNTRLGVAGLTTAFAGGALMAIGHRMSRQVPDIQVGVGRFAVSRRVSW
jgi:hypothetical protein